MRGSSIPLAHFTKDEDMLLKIEKDGSGVITLQVEGVSVS
jgi:hypothetical protein